MGLNNAPETINTLKDYRAFAERLLGVYTWLKAQDYTMLNQTFQSAKGTDVILTGPLGDINNNDAQELFMVMQSMITTLEAKPTRLAMLRKLSV